MRLGLAKSHAGVAKLLVPVARVEAALKTVVVSSSTGDLHITIQQLLYVLKPCMAQSCHKALVFHVFEVLFSSQEGKPFSKQIWRTTAEAGAPHVVKVLTSFGYNATTPGIGKDKVTKQLHVNQAAVQKLLGQEVADLLVEFQVVPVEELAQYITDATAAMMALQTQQLVTTTGAMVTESVTAAVKQDGKVTRDAIETGNAKLAAVIETKVEDASDMLKSEVQGLATAIKAAARIDTSKLNDVLLLAKEHNDDITDDIITTILQCATLANDANDEPEEKLEPRQLSRCGSVREVSVGGSVATAARATGAIQAVLEDLTERGTLSPETRRSLGGHDSVGTESVAVDVLQSEEKEQLPVDVSTLALSSLPKRAGGSGDSDINPFLSCVANYGSEIVFGGEAPEPLMHTRDEDEMTIGTLASQGEPSEFAAAVRRAAAAQEWSQQARCGKGYKLPKEIKRLPTVAKDRYNTGKSQVPPTKHQRQAVKERTKEHDVAEAAHLDPKYWRSTSDDEEKRA